MCATSRVATKTGQVRFLRGSHKKMARKSGDKEWTTIVRKSELVIIENEKVYLGDEKRRGNWSDTFLLQFQLFIS